MVKAISDYCDKKDLDNNLSSGKRHSGSFNGF